MAGALFSRGKEVLGQKAGGFITKLRNAVESDALALHHIDVAAKKQNPREYIGAIIRNRAGEPEPKFPGYVPMHPGAGG